MIPLPPRGTPERDLYIQRMLSDTGFFCRAVLGNDTDEDPTIFVSKRGEGGIRDHGPHQVATEFMDEQFVELAEGEALKPEIQYRVLAMPRFTYKSSRVTGLICRLILRHPDISIMLSMATKKDAEERVLKIREILETNPIIRELRGDPEGPVWQRSHFVTAWRQNRTILSPTLFAASPQTGLAGNRPDVAIFDDVSNEKTSTDAKKAAVVRHLESAVSTQGRTARFLMVCTPWYEGDGFSWAIDKAGWNGLIHLDAGVEVIRDASGRPDVVVAHGRTEPRWPNLPLEVLRRYVRGGMTPEFFTSQFLLKMVGSTDPHWKPAYFFPIAWNDSMQKLSGYQLCDVAPSGEPGGDQNVIFYVGLDESFLYLLDCEVGYWQQSEFCERYVAMLARWQAKVRHRGDVWEKGQTFYGYTEQIRTMCQQKHVRFDLLHADQRNNTSKSKDARILSLPVRFQTGRVRVCVTTMPRTWHNKTMLKPLYEAEGAKDLKTGMKIPAGELVDQFVRFPHHPRKDIPDCLTLVDCMDDTGNRRVCFYVPPETAQVSPDVLRVPPEDEKYIGMGSGDRFFEKWFGR